MTIRTREPLVRQQAGQELPFPSTPERSVRRAGLVAGTGILLLAAAGGFGVTIAEGLLTPGQAARTTADVVASQGLLRASVASLFVAVVLDVVIAVALFHLFRPVSGRASMLAAGLRVGYAVVFLTATTQLVGVLSALGAGGSSTRVLAGMSAFTDVLDVGLLLFGAHLLVVAHLVHRSGYVPRLLGLLLALGGLGYIADTAVAALLPGSAAGLGRYTLPGEISGETLLALWLVVRSHRITLPAAAPTAEQARSAARRAARS